MGHTLFYLGNRRIQLFCDSIEFFFHLKDLLVTIGDFMFSIGSLLFSGFQFVLNLKMIYEDIDPKKI